MPRLPLTDHLNLLWSSLVVAEIIKNGIDTFFMSPGNRNAPLISVLAYEDRAIKKICVDERAAGYRALGYARATGRPGVLVCTSGTAPANYYPAVIEACREDLPMIILSADRPPELVGSDANQTIVQEELFGCYCRDALFLPCPDSDYPLEALLAKIDHIISNPSGPVHINCPFRDPLIPGASGQSPVGAEVAKKARHLIDTPRPYTVYTKQATVPSEMTELTKALQNARRGLIVVGRLDALGDTEALESLMQSINWPVFCDVASSLRALIPAERQLFNPDHPETIRLIQAYDPDVILQFGSGLVSKHYYASILAQSRAFVIQVSPRSGLRDPAHRVNLRICAPVHTVAALLKKENFSSPEKDALHVLLENMSSLCLLMQQSMDREALSFPLIASTLLPLVPEGEGLFLGNSLTIRAFDAVSSALPGRIRIVSNRGVSGIEGNIATSVGFAEGLGLRVTAVIGDISFLHDLNSLLLMMQSRTPVILMVVNNAGGRIFERLPIRDYPEIINPYMTTPHDMSFRLIAEQFRLPYVRIDEPGDLGEAYLRALQSSRSVLLEIILSPEEDLRVFKTIQQACLP